MMISKVNERVMMLRVVIGQGEDVTCFWRLKIELIFSFIIVSWNNARMGAPYSTHAAIPKLSKLMSKLSNGKAIALFLSSLNIYLIFK